MSVMELGVDQGSWTPTPFCILHEGKESPETSSRGEIQKTVCLFGFKCEVPQKNPAKTSQCTSSCRHPGARRCMPRQASHHPPLSLPTLSFTLEISSMMVLISFSVWSGEVSGDLFEVVSSLESSPRGTGVGKAVATTRSSPREKASGLKVSVPEGRESSSEQAGPLRKLSFWLLAACQPLRQAQTLSHPGRAPGSSQAVTG